MSNTPKSPRFATSSILDGVAVITIDNPPVNALSTGVPEALVEELRSAFAHPEVRAIVIAGAGRTFIAGVDIRELQDMAAGLRPILDFNPYLQAIEDSPKPVVAAIHGTALGGGLETAMAAHYRVVAPNAQMGQPEVKLGLIPGMAGTQRLPRLVGMLKAAELCTRGEPVKASEAVQIGLADAVIEGDFIAGAVAFANEKAGAPVVKTRDRSVTPVDLSSVRKSLEGFNRYGGAPKAALDAIEAATLPFDGGVRYEREIFQQRLASDEAKALIHAFFAERSTVRIAAEALPVQRVGVIGGGTMGSGIAIALADAGSDVLLKDVSEDALKRGMDLVGSTYDRSVARGRISADEAARRKGRIRGQLDFSGFDELDLVIEAAFEKLSVKRGIFSELAAHTRPHCLLATNTSSLDVDQIASAVPNHERVLGLHFFSPANVARLLEVIRTEHTSDGALAAGLAMGKRLNKIVVVSRNAPGFIGNRIFAPYFREARMLVEEGAAVDEVNNALTAWGMAMGPLAVDDLVGLDIALEIEELGGRRSPLLRSLVDAGKLGQKTGEGWSRYDSNRRPISQLPGTHPGPFSQQVIVQRCINALVERSKEVLAEGTAAQAVDIDMVAIHGFGFPAWRGGPLFHAGSKSTTKH